MAHADAQRAIQPGQLGPLGSISTGSGRSPTSARPSSSSGRARGRELLDNLDGLAELLDVDDFPRTEPYTTARREGIRLGAVRLACAVPTPSPPLFLDRCTG